MRQRRARTSVRVLEPDDWPALAALFGERGACAGCWCMAWRLTSKRWEAGRGASNRRAMKRLVDRGRATGVLAFAGEEAVGWCSIGPRADFVALETKRSLVTDWDEHTWSVTCFFIAKDWRGQGLGKKLLDGAVKLARKHRARRIEGYPTSLPRSGGTLPVAFAWTGLPQIFERCGFRALADTPGKRAIYVRDLGRGTRSSRA